MSRLLVCNDYKLDATEDAVLEVLRRRTSFTSKQMMMLEWMENGVRLNNDCCAESRQKKNFFTQPWD